MAIITTAKHSRHIGLLNAGSPDSRNATTPSGLISSIFLIMRAVTDGSVGLQFFNFMAVSRRKTIYRKNRTRSSGKLYQTDTRYTR